MVLSNGELAPAANVSAADRIVITVRFPATLLRLRVRVLEPVHKEPANASSY